MSEQQGSLCTGGVGVGGGGGGCGGAGGGGGPGGFAGSFSDVKLHLSLGSMGQPGVAQPPGMVHPPQPPVHSLLKSQVLYQEQSFQPSGAGGENDA